MGLFTSIAYAAGEAANTAATGAAGVDPTQMGEVNPVMSALVSFGPIILIIIIFYFMMIRPQRKREKETQAMINALKVGDKVTTIGGITGEIDRIKDNTVVIKTGNVGTPDQVSYIKMERDSIKSVAKKLSN